MTPEYLKKLSQLSVSSLAGFLVSGSSVSLMIALLNDMAQDEPSFLPWLIALFLITPVMGVLITLEVGALLYEWVTGNNLGWDILDPPVQGEKLGGISDD